MPSPIRRLNTPVVWIASSLKPYICLINKTFKETNPKRCQAPFSIRKSPKENPFPGETSPCEAIVHVTEHLSRVFLSLSLSIYTPVVWIAFENYLIASLYMAASLTESVYIYSCCLDRLVSEM